MPELTWFELFPPADAELADITRVVRVLGGRSRRGWQRLTPVISFEVWVAPGRVRWLLGTDVRLNRSVPRELRAQLPKLAIARCESSPRRQPITGREVRFYSQVFPLRLDTAAAITAGVLTLTQELRGTESVALQWVVGPSIDRAQRPVKFAPLESLGLRPPAKANVNEQTAWKAKVSEPLFGIRGRVGANASDLKRAGALINEVRAAVALASGPHARLRASQQSSRTAQQLFAVQGGTRTWSSILNAAELAAVLAWPHEGTEIPDQRVLFGPAPASLLFSEDTADDNQHDTTDRTLGRSLHPANTGQLVRLPVASCLTHIHLIAPTGSGKSTELARWILSDAHAGRSCLLIEPKGDLVADVLSRMPTERHDDVVVIEPGDDEQVIGINPLTGDRTDAERRADELLALFRELFGSAIGPRSADVLLHALIAVARLDDGTMTDVPTLLTNSSFRRQVLAKVNDPLVLAPFWASFEARSELDRNQVIAPLLNKLRAFISRPAIRRLLGQPQPRFALDSLFTENPIVLINLNQGVLGPETARLVGTLVLHQLWQAIQRRAQVPSAKRHPVMVVIDEFQDYTGALDFAAVLATSRGLGVGWTLAHQHLAQLSPVLKAAVLANARSRLVWRPAQDDAKALADVLGSDVTAADLERLGAFQAVARLLFDNTPTAAFGVQTLPLAEPTTDARALRAASAARYGVDAAELDVWQLARWQGDTKQPDGDAVGVKKRRQQP